MEKQILRRIDEILDQWGANGAHGIVNKGGIVSAIEDAIGESILYDLEDEGLIEMALNGRAFWILQSGIDLL